MPASVEGSKPGFLDATQPGRLLRGPGSSLLFATLDPKVAPARGTSRSKTYKFSPRIVIETLANGDVFWRFVPLLQLAIGVNDEGQWPRFVSFCGEMLIMSLDQWDIHKLDPGYDCLITSAGVPTITLSMIHPHYRQSTEGKCGVDVPFMSAQTRPGEQPFAASEPIRSSQPKLDHDSGDEDWQECEPIEVDDPIDEPSSTIHVSQNLDSPPVDPNPQTETRPHHVPPLDHGHSVPQLPTYDSTRAEVLQRELAARRAARAEKLRKIKTQYDETEGARFRQLVHDILAPTKTPLSSAQENIQMKSLPTSPTSLSDVKADTATVPGQHTGVGAAARPEIHHSSTLSEDAAKLEALARRDAEIEASKRLMEAEARKKEEIRSKYLAEQQRVFNRADSYRPTGNHWPAVSAWEFFTSLTKDFDKKTYNEESPLTVHSVPWPIFTDPRKFQVENMTSEDVENFLVWSNHQLDNPKAFKTLLVQARQRFHPDKWGAPNRLAGVPDIQLRQNIEAAIGIVAKAVGGIFDQVKTEEERQAEEERKRQEEKVRRGQQQELWRRGFAW